MAITNPTKYVSVQRLSRFEAKLAQKYQTQAIAAITGLSAETVEAALAELLGKIQALPSAIVPKGSKAFAGLTQGINVRIPDSVTIIATDAFNNSVTWEILVRLDALADQMPGQRPGALGAHFAFFVIARVERGDHA